jgi:hypothetical protein
MGSTPSPFTVAVDRIYAPNLAIAVEDVIVFVLPLAAFAGDIGAAKDQDWVGHSGIICSVVHKQEHLGRSTTMISRQTAALVSGPAVGCMLFVAWTEFSEGKLLGEIHLTAPAPLMIASSGSIGSMAGLNLAITRFSCANFNTIVDADYTPAADSRMLRRDGLAHPSRSPEACCLIGNHDAATLARTRGTLRQFQKTK